MNSFEFKDYTNFSNAINSTKIEQLMLNDKLSNTHKYITNMDADDVFTGAICDNVMEEWQIISEQISKDIYLLNMITSYLSFASSNYSSADSNNASNIGGIK